jgi:hypothetical protein
MDVDDEEDDAADFDLCGSGLEETASTKFSHSIVVHSCVLSLRLVLTRSIG